MDGQTDVLELAVVVAVAVLAILFVLLVESGGPQRYGIEQAIEDGRIIVGMTKDDVINSWGRPYHAEEHSIRLLDVDTLATLTWTYENPHRTVHFNSDGIVIWVVD